MKTTTKVYAELAKDEYFRIADTVYTYGIEVHNLQVAFPVEDHSVFAFGPRLLKSGEMSEQRHACALLKFADLPAALAAQIQSAVPPAAAGPVGAEAARQAALG